MSKQPYPRIIIEIDGGLIQRVLCSIPTDVVVLDLDVESAPEEDIIELEAKDGSTLKAAARITHVVDEDGVSAERVEKVYKVVLVQLHKNGSPT